MARVTAKALGRSSIYGVFSQIWKISSRIVLTPMIIKQIGLDGYGTWTLLFTICAYTGIIDRTFNAAYTKFTAEHDARREYEQLGEIISSGVVLVAVCSALILGFIYVTRDAVLGILSVPDSDVVLAGQALGTVCIAVFLRIVFGYALQVLSGLQRLDVQHKILMFSSVAEFVAAMVLLWLGWGLQGLAIGYLMGQAFAVIGAWWLCRGMCPELRVSPRLATRDGLRKIGSLGGRFQAVAFLQLFMIQGTKLLISGLLGVAILGVYELAFKLMALASAVGFAVVGPLMPAFANIQARGTGKEFRAILLFASKAVAVIALPVFAFVAIFADRMIFLWTGHEYELAAWTVRCMTPSLFVLMLTAVGTASLRGRGTVRLEVAFTLLSAIILVVLVMPLYWLWGYEGIIWAIVARSIIGSAWFIVVFARREAVDLMGLMRETLLKPAVVLGPIFLLAGLLEPRLYVPWGLSSGRFETLLDLGVSGFVFTGIVAACAWFGLLTLQERADFVRRFGRAPKPAATD